ncbi:sensor histidine kinase [Nucisporomicrobium flavum]|uniref:sensor histidine kinase n=1 Tax=Nucisporomicrobium flavum TaxID=2785915 RepID=UPI0018F65CBD|nr:ATP-binding protein [Nucisporomicrobium flavum]
MWRRLVIGSVALSCLAAVVIGAVWRIRSDMAWPFPGIPAAVWPRALIADVIVTALAALGWTAAGCTLAALRPRNVLGWVLLAMGAIQSYLQPLDAVISPNGPVMADPPPLLSGLSSVLDGVLLLSLLSVVLALYPDGRLPARWWRWPVGAATAGIVLLLVYDVFESVLDRWRLDLWDDVVGIFLFTPAAVTIWVGTFIRWRHAVYPYRQQLAWYVGSGVVPTAFSWLALLVPLDHVELEALISALTSPWLMMPFGIAVGVLQYRLLGVRAVLRRGLVYAVLTALVFAVYLTVSAVLSTVLERSALPAVVAAAIVAVGLAPAREWLQRAANRVIYGARRDPLRALTDLSNSVAVTDHLELLPAALAAVVSAVRADGATIVTLGGRTLASAGDEPARYLALPLRFGGAEIGELRVAHPPAGERYAEVEGRLLTALAAQLAVVVSATELTEALDAERNRVVTATRDERDRLRSDLHDGLGPSLTGMSLGLQALEGLVGEPSAATLVRRLREETDTAVRDVRRIIDGLRPTVLDSAGLTRAIERHAGTLDAALPVDVTTDALPVLAPDVEVAAYRIITEALTNAARHARAEHARVVISADDALHIAVSDDGHGMGSLDASAGVGLTSMRRRAEALGGEFGVRSTDAGTTITATLPLRRS